MVLNSIRNVEIVIFDMDGVLIDVSESYRETIKKAVAIYLKRALGLKGGEKGLVSDDDIVAFKEIGGLNNDWDVTTGLLYYFVTLLEGGEPGDAPKMDSMDEVVSFLRENRIGTGLEAVKKALNSGKTRYIFGTGDLKVDNLVKRLFQEIYLGPSFRTIYHGPPLFYSGRGLFERERLMVKRKSLSILSNRLKLGIASGRPRAEAILGLRNFRIESYFRSLVALEDCEAEQERILTLEGKRVNLSKPNPFSIIEAVGQINPGRVSCAYVGDIPDDIEAANRAKGEIDIMSVGCLGPYEDRARTRKRFLEMGADLIIEGVDDLVGLIQ